MDIRQLLKNKKIAILVLAFIAISTVMVILAIITRINTAQNQDQKTEVDKASGLELLERTGAVIPSSQDGKPVLIGFYTLLDSGVSRDMFDDISKLFYSYNNTLSQKMKRVSLYKGSYLQTSDTGVSPAIYQAKFAIDNDTNRNLYLKIASYSYGKYDLFLYEDEKMTKEVQKYSYCSVLICKPTKPQNVTNTNIQD